VFPGILIRGVMNAGGNCKIVKSSFSEGVGRGERGMKEMKSVRKKRRKEEKSGREKRRERKRKRR
jgi:hypothetical protein